MKFARFMGELLSAKSREAAPAAEVSLTSCTLEDVDVAVSRKLSQGEELEMANEGGKVTVMKGGRVAGSLPESECARVARLLDGKTGLCCRVGAVDKKLGMVRVRILIRM